MFCFPPYFRRFVEEKVFGVRNWLSPLLIILRWLLYVVKYVYPINVQGCALHFEWRVSLATKIESPPNHIKHSLTNHLLNHPEIKHFYYQTHMQRPSKTSDKLFQLTPTLRQKESFLQTTLSILRINILPQ